jgi:hypothetical protein
LRVGHIVVGDRAPSPANHRESHPSDVGAVAFPSMTRRRRTSVKIMAASRPPISRVASAASAPFALDGAHFVGLRAVPPSANGVQRRPRRSIRFDGSVALAPWLDSAPERSSRSVFNRRTSAARRRGSGVEMTSAKAFRNPPASVNGNFIRSNGTLAGRRIATGSPTKNLPRAVLRLLRKMRERRFCSARSAKQESWTRPR